MSLVRTAILVAAGVALAGSARPAERAAPPPSSLQRTAAAAGDTLRYEVRAGQAFLVALPARVGGAAAEYRVVSAPAMSWLVDRSFFWQTIASERGLMPVVFQYSAAPDDTLVLLVEVTE